MDLHQLATTTRAGLPVVLAPFIPSDVDRVYELCQDPEIQRWTMVPSPYPRGSAEMFINVNTPLAWREVNRGIFSSEQTGPELTWAVRVVGDSPLAGLWGSIGLTRHGAGRYEIGWWLGAAVRGQGIMRAATAKAVEVAFSPDAPLRASEVWWYAKIGNLPSAAVAMRTGFQYMGIDQARHTDDGVQGPGAWSAVIRAGDALEPRDDWPMLSASEPDVDAAGGCGDLKH